jgi:hypothetical protein
MMPSAVAAVQSLPRYGNRVVGGGIRGWPARSLAPHLARAIEVRRRLAADAAAVIFADQAAFLLTLLSAMAVSFWSVAFSSSSV